MFFHLFPKVFCSSVRGDLSEPANGLLDMLSLVLRRVTMNRPSRHFILAAYPVEPLSSFITVP